MSDRTTLSEKSIISMTETRRKKLSLIQEVAEEIVKLLSLFIISQVRDDLTSPLLTSNGPIRAETQHSSTIRCVAFQADMSLYPWYWFMGFKAFEGQLLINPRHLYVYGNSSIFF